MKAKYNTYSMLALCLVHAGVGTSVSVALSGDDLPPLPNHVEVTVDVADAAIVTFQPLIARVTLTNRDAEPFTLDVRNDGAPHAVTSLVTYGEGERFEHRQWLGCTGPEHHSIVLGPGESTTGEMLIWIAPPTGFAFSEPGTYFVQLAFQPDPRYAPVVTNTLELRVVADELRNRQFLTELSELSYAYFGYDRDILRRNEGEDILIGYELIRKILKVQGPHRIDPEGNAHNRKQAKFVETLTNMLERFPDTSYSPYIARFLGLVDLGTLEQNWSVKRDQALREKGKAPHFEQAQIIADPPFQRALRYLNIAAKADICPRTVAPYNLAWLHGAAQQWDKAAEYTRILRSRYSHLDGARLADKLDYAIRKAKSKIDRRKGLPDATTTDGSNEPGADG